MEKQLTLNDPRHKCLTQNNKIAGIKHKRKSYGFGFDDAFLAMTQKAQSMEERIANEKDFAKKMNK